MEPRGLWYSRSLTQPHDVWDHVNSRLVANLTRDMPSCPQSLTGTHPGNISSLEACTQRTFLPSLYSSSRFCLESEKQQGRTPSTCISWTQHGHEHLLRSLNIRQGHYTTCPKYHAVSQHLLCVMQPCYTSIEPSRCIYWRLTFILLPLLHMHCAILLGLWNIVQSRSMQ